MVSVRGRKTILLGAALLWGCAAFPPLPPSALEPEWQVHRLEAAAIRESSGLVASRQYPGIFWTHNDSGDIPRIFAITAEGGLVAEFRVEGALHRDWEDIAADPDGNLYVGDFGNNFNDRRDLRVYRIPEPDPAGGDGVAWADRELPFRYADQRAFPDPKARNFDAEALFWMDGGLVILTKHRSDTRSQLYRLPAEPLPGGEERVLEPVARLEMGGSRARFFGNVSGADLHPEGRLLAVLTYSAIHLYAAGGAPDTPFREVRRIELRRRRTRQAESIAWDGDDLLFGNEQGYLFRIPDVGSGTSPSTGSPSSRDRTRIGMLYP